MRKLTLGLLAVFTIATISFAAAPKGCYEIYGIEVAPKINTAFFVLIDETTHFDKKLQEQVISNALAFTKSSNHIFIGKFSALIGGGYNEPVFEFAIDRRLNDDERYTISKATLAKVDKCLKDQIGFVKKSVQSAISSTFAKKSIGKSDILYALDDFSKSVIEPINADRKIVLLASDMLENSTITSFYANNHIRQINHKKELSIVEENRIFGDFGGASIYVVGAGLIPNSKSYVDPKKLNNLKIFWNDYFNKSNATLEYFGTPALKKSIQ